MARDNFFPVVMVNLLAEKGLKKMNYQQGEKRVTGDFQLILLE
jgi:hypothetical protein